MFALFSPYTAAERTPEQKGCQLQKVHLPPLACKPPGSQATAFAHCTAPPDVQLTKRHTLACILWQVLLLENEHHLLYILRLEHSSLLPFARN